MIMRIANKNTHPCLLFLLLLCLMITNNIRTAEANDDLSISNEVKSRLQTDSLHIISDMIVSVEKGTVTISGIVMNQQTANQVIEIISRVPGVIQVKPEL